MKRLIAFTFGALIFLTLFAALKVATLDYSKPQVAGTSTSK